MADHGDAPFIAVPTGLFFNTNDIPGVFASSWSKEFVQRLRRDAGGTGV